MIEDGHCASSGARPANSERRFPKNRGSWCWLESWPSPRVDLTFLVTEYGRPFTAAGFGGWFRARCDEAGLPDRTARASQAGATLAAEASASVHELMAIFDWRRTPAQTKVYTDFATVMSHRNKINNLGPNWQK